MSSALTLEELELRLLLVAEGVRDLEIAGDWSRDLECERDREEERDPVPLSLAFSPTCKCSGDALKMSASANNGAKDGDSLFVGSCPSGFTLVASDILQVLDNRIISYCNSFFSSRV